MAPSELSIVHIYELADRLFVHPLALTDAGFWLAVSPARRLERDPAPDSLGGIVSELAQPREQRVPAPARTDYPTVLAPILDVAGVRSWTRLEREARLCEVARKVTELVVIPTESSEQKGFSRLEMLAQAFPLAVSSTELGRAVLVGLTQSRSRVRNGAV